MKETVCVGVVGAGAVGAGVVRAGAAGAAVKAGSPGSAMDAQPESRDTSRAKIRITDSFFMEASFLS